MDKDQAEAIIEGIEKKAEAQGLTALKDIPDGSKVMKWNLGRNEPEEDAHGKAITFTIAEKRPNRVRGYFLVRITDDDGDEDTTANLHGTTFFKVL